MTNEIKEIFKRMNDLIEHRFDKEYHTKCDLFTDIQGLLDYITNLQEENERLSVELNKNMIERNNYLSRNEKAIEYIKLAIENIEPNLYDNELDDLYILLSILQGSDKE